MHLTKTCWGQLVVLGLQTPALNAVNVLKLREEIQMICARAAPHILLDLSQVQRLEYAALAVLVELLQHSPDRQGLSLCGLTPKIKKLLKDTHLERLFKTFATVNAALKPGALGHLTLADRQALILTAGIGSRARPLTFTTPKPMLELGGKPIAHHCLDHLLRFGIKKIAMNTSYLPEHIEEYFGRGGKFGVDLLFSREGQMTLQGFQGQAIGSAAAMRLVQQRHQYFDRDFIVLCGDALIDIDFAAMMRRHLETGAIVTIATQEITSDHLHKYGVVAADGQGRVTSFQEKPCAKTALSLQANCGIYIFSPKIFNHMPRKGSYDIGSQLLPSLVQNNQHVQRFSAKFNWTDVGCIQDYFRANAQLLAGEIPGISPSARQIRDSVWAEEGAEVSPLARIHGPCLIGANSIIAPGATLVGTVIIGANCEVEGRVYLRDSIIMPGTKIRDGAIVSGMLSGPNWSLRHSYATREVTNFEPLDYVVARHHPPLNRYVQPLRA